jgi:hypothetical protein
MDRQDYPVRIVRRGEAEEDPYVDPPFGVW